MYKKGFTIIEFIISIAILSLLTYTVSTFQRDVFSLSTNLQSSLNAQLEARHLIKTMVSELRKVTPSANGAYPIELASSTGITFYSDINDNGTVEKVRYYLHNKTIRKGVITPTGNPPVYNSGSEVTTTLLNYVLASSTLPIFQYYTSNYSGTTSPISMPPNISTIRLVKITVIIDTDPNRSPTPIISTSQVNLRNLKDNL
ncbi:MAG TPA: prepilin-type N-terminal cleavage/methylation domain-containing protein [Parcubacteria group bacterium]|jgi:prepilin-type N-terminal cleavage/methylation domain-containing protein|nr:prepilin-type N-terminal cleavage/methylation domain-containing protein [Parcubacteria group bacterium]